jgi:3-dehydroquinate dehydratase-2
MNLEIRTMVKLYILNGPNLNFLGKRQPDVYGIATLDDIKSTIVNLVDNVELDFYQTNSEAELIDYVHKIFVTANQGQLADISVGVIINPGAFTHYSYALYDALLMLKDVRIPVIELHISNPTSRDEFRHNSVVAPAVTATIAGCGVQGYALATEHILHLLQTTNSDSITATDSTSDSEVEAMKGGATPN